MTPLGPSDPTRSAAPELLQRAQRAACMAGVTRLADITRLDRLGLPVWQAVRPMSRALSVHQGRGGTEAEAQIGALLEAVESHHAENFEADGPICSWAALAPSERAPCMSDFSLDRRLEPSEAEHRRWVAAPNPLTGGILYVPFETVSLDFTRMLPSGFERSSNGVATGVTKEAAIVAALSELIERDAVHEWQAGGLLACTSSIIEASSVPFGWFRLWLDRFDDAGIAARFFAVPAVTGSPVFVCELNDVSKDAAPYRANQGRGCHSVPEVALFKALSEAVQARATFIAGARDDLVPRSYDRPKAGVVNLAFALPLPPGMKGIHWDSIRAGPGTLAEIILAFEAAGYDQIGIVELGAPEGFFVVRAFVCGLGSMERRRRSGRG